MPYWVKHGDNDRAMSDCKPVMFVSYTNAWGFTKNLSHTSSFVIYGKVMPPGDKQQVKQVIYSNIDSATPLAFFKSMGLTRKKIPNIKTTRTGKK